MSIFDTTRVQDVTAHKETSIVGGTNPYEGIPELMELGWEVGKGAMQGRAQRRLIGDEAGAAEVQDDDIYGTYTHEDGEPVELNIDQDLTRITNARKQGNISAERARALVNIRTRQAINDNPMFARELQQRANRFFEEIGGGGTRGGGAGGVLQPTSAEQMEQKIHESNVMDLRKEQMEAEKLGLSVPELRRRQREQADRDMARDRMAMRSDEAQYAETMDEQERRAATKEFNHDIGMMKVDAQLQVQQHVASIIEQSPEGITAETRAGLRNQIQGQASEFLALAQANRGTLGTEEFKKQRQEIEKWRDNLIGVVEEADLEAVYESVRDRTNVTSDMVIQQEMPLMWALFRTDSELGKAAIQLESDRDRLEMLANTGSSIAKFIIENEDILEGRGIGTLISSAFEYSATGSPEARERMPGSEEDKDNLTDYLQLEEIAGKIGAGEKMHERAWANYTDIVDREGAVALNAATTPAAQREVRADPEKQRTLANTYDYALRGVSLAIERGDIDLSKFDINIPDRAEHDPRRPGDHPHKNQSILSSEFWNQRRFGHTGGPPVSVSPILPDLSPMDRREFAGGRGREDREALRETASQLESLARIAATYPELEVGGETLLDRFVGMTGIGQQVRDEYGMSEEQTRQIEQEEAARQDPIPGPFIREDREVDTSVEDVEFTDTREQFAGDASRSLEQGEFSVQQPEVISEGRPIEPIEDTRGTSQPVEEVFKHLAEREGVGDDVTDVPTGALGVTQAARDAVGAGDDVPDAEVARMYLDHLDATFERGLEGYANAPAEAQEMILDAAYNMGEQISSFPGFSSALAVGNYEEAGKQLLDTANVRHEGTLKSVKGLAKRRAQSYNLLTDDPITTVEQLDDGTIRYLNEGGQVIFEYRPAGGRRKADDKTAGSAPGKIKV